MGWSAQNDGLEADRLRRKRWHWPGLHGESGRGYRNTFEVVWLGAFGRAEIKEWLDQVMSHPEQAHK
jgi:hypothetical protein